MPFRSKAQQRYMFKFHPDIAKEFASKTPNMKGLPEHAGGTGRKRGKRIGNQVPTSSTVHKRPRAKK